MPLRTAILAALLGVLGCDINDGEPLPVGVRVQNASDLDFSDVTAQFGADQFGFGSVAAGGTTGYASFETVSQGRAIAVVANGETYEISEVELGGRQALDAGEEYTLVLDLVGSDLTSAFQQD